MATDHRHRLNEGGIIQVSVETIHQRFHLIIKCTHAIVQSVDTLACFRALVNGHLAVEPDLGPSCRPLVLYSEAQLQPTVLVVLPMEVQIVKLSIHHIFAELHPFRQIWQLIPFREGIGRWNILEAANCPEVCRQLCCGIGHPLMQLSLELPQNVLQHNAKFSIMIGLSSPGSGVVFPHSHVLPIQQSTLSLPPH
jgi:hypothetical protein